MKKYAFAAAAVLLLTGCSASENTAAESVRVISEYSNVSNGGELFTDSMLRLNFYDFTEMDAVLLCTDPSCTHTDESACSAFGMSDHPFIFGENLYYFTTDFFYSESTGEYVDESRLYSASFNGTDRAELLKIDGLSVRSYGNMELVGSTLYFTAVDAGYDKYGNNGWEQSDDIFLCSIDLSQNSFSRHEKICSGYSAGVYVCGYFDGGLYFITSSSAEPVPYDTDLSALALPAEYFRMDVSTGDISECNIQPTCVCDKALVYADGEGYTLELPDGRKLTFEKDIAAVLDNYAFSGDMQSAVRLSDGALLELSDNASGKTPAAYFDGKLIFKTSTGDGYDYISLTEKETFR